MDTTLFAHDGRWWMFTNISHHPGVSPHAELFIFYADNPLSDQWQAHPMNPVISDVRRARGAGRIFRAGEKIYRPSQACAPEYGYGIRLNEILTLTTQEYRERECKFIEPNWTKGLTGVHTLATDGVLTVFDARRAIWRRPKFLGPVKGRQAHATQSSEL